MSFATITCIGFLVFFQCEEKTKARPDPQKVVCSGPAAPVLTPAELAATPEKVRRFVGKVKKNRKDANCKQ